MPTSGKKYKELFLYSAPFFAAAIFLTALVQNNAFFWDTIQLASKHAHWYYENNFSYFFLPNNMDSGHFPIFGMYVAICWKIFGRSLMVSHWSMFPFIIGAIWQTARLVTFYFPKKLRLIIMALLLSDAVLISQFSIVSPDIILMFAFIFCLNSIIREQKTLILLSSIPLAIISMRGFMVLAGLGLAHALIIISAEKKFDIGLLIKKLSIYFPAIIIISTFFVLHQLNKGWFAYHSDSPWASCFQRSDFYGILYNIGIAIWRFIDYGKVSLFLLLGGLIFWQIRTFGFKAMKNIIIQEKNPLIFLSTVFITTVPILLLYKILLGHRYLMPFIFLVFLSFSYLIVKTEMKNKLRKILILIVIMSNITGHFIIYPTKISQGWDATLAHLPYYELRQKMITFINENNIAYKETGTAFPAKESGYITDLNKDKRQFAELDLEKNNYIIHSNIFNDFSDEQLLALEKLKLIKEYKTGRIFMKLYKKE